MARRGEPQLHQRNEALPARQKLGFLAQFAEQRSRFRQSFRPMILKCPRIHPDPTTDCELLMAPR